MDEILRQYCQHTWMCLGCADVCAAHNTDVVGGDSALARSGWVDISVLSATPACRVAAIRPAVNAGNRVSYVCVSLAAFDVRLLPVRVRDESPDHVGTQRCDMQSGIDVHPVLKLEKRMHVTCARRFAPGYALCDRQFQLRLRTRANRPFRSNSVLAVSCGARTSRCGSGTRPRGPGCLYVSLHR